MSNKDVIEYYNNTALVNRLFWSDEKTLACHLGFYDRDYITHAQALLRLNSNICDSAKISKNDHVLDAGCGLGGTSIWLAKKVECSVVGIDLHPRRIATARKSAMSTNLSDRVAFTVGSYEHLPFPDNHFNAVLAVETLCHCNNKGKFFAEAARVLRPGGRLVVNDFIQSRSPNTPDEVKILDQWLDG